MVLSRYRGIDILRVIRSLFYLGYFFNYLSDIFKAVLSVHWEREETTVQFQPNSITQFDEHPSPLCVLPSSH
jgi:hypothetical protein